MSVSFEIDFLSYEIGSSDFLHSFFSNIAYHLENGKWGKEYPIIMNELYQGNLSWEKTDQALLEIKKIKERFKKIKPEQVIWDIDDLSKNPPWGNKISNDITDLANYFITSDGRDFFEILTLAINDSKNEKINLKIV